MYDVHLSTARYFRYDQRLTAENFQQQFGAQEVCRASQCQSASVKRLFATPLMSKNVILRASPVCSAFQDTTCPRARRQLPNANYELPNLMRGASWTQGYGYTKVCLKCIVCVIHQAKLLCNGENVKWVSGQASPCSLLAMLSARSSRMQHSCHNLALQITVALSPKSRGKVFNLSTEQLDGRCPSFDSYSSPLSLQATSAENFPQQYRAWAGRCAAHHKVTQPGFTLHLIFELK